MGISVLMKKLHKSDLKDSTKMLSTIFKDFGSGSNQIRISGIPIRTTDRIQSLMVRYVFKL